MGRERGSEVGGVHLSHFAWVILAALTAVFALTSEI